MSEQNITEVGGKRYAGVIVNARPFTERWPRCIYGFLYGLDLKQRGFDNSPIRTSIVERLLVEDGKLYAITMNSAYQINSVDLVSFINCPEWVEDIDDVIKQAIAIKRKELKLD